MLSGYVRVAAILVALLVRAPSPSIAQDWSKLWKEPEVVNCELTMEKVRTLVDVQRAMSALAASDPGVEAQTTRDFRALTTPTIAVAAAVLDKNASMRGAFGKAGMTSREWLVANGALGNASIALMLLKRGSGSIATSAAQKANVALLEKNAAEWQKLEQEMARLGAEAAARAKKGRTPG